MTEPILPPTVALVLHFRNATVTAACLRSLHEEAVKRLVLVDNSEDEGKSLLQLSEDLQSLRMAGMEIVVLEPGHNLGFSAGVNRGLALIYQRFGPASVLLINSDAQLAPRAHQLLRLALNEFDGKAVCAPFLRASNGTLVASVFYHRVFGLYLRRPMLGAFQYVSGCCLLLPPALTASPLFDEEFFFYGDDVELGWRLADTGIVLRLVDGAYADHDGSGSSHNGSLFYEYHMARAHLALTRKLGAGAFGRIVMLLGRFMLLPARALVRSIRFRSLSPWRGLGMACVDFARGRRRSLTPPSTD